MRATLKQHTLSDLQHDLQSLEYSRSIQEISEKAYNIRRGKLNAEIARRETNHKPINLCK